MLVYWLFKNMHPNNEPALCFESFEINYVNCYGDNVVGWQESQSRGFLKVQDVLVLPKKECPTKLS